MNFDWHSDLIERDLKVTPDYKSTQNVRRFMRQECGARFKFDQPFMDWITNGSDKTMGEAVDEWKRRNPNA